MNMMNFNMSRSSYLKSNCSDYDSDSRSTTQSTCFNHSPSESDVDAETCEFTTTHRKHRKSKKRKKYSKRSGLLARARSTNIVHKVKYAHAYLKYEFHQEEKNFDELSFALLAAGEMEILSKTSISSAERTSRKYLIKRL